MKKALVILICASQLSSYGTANANDGTGKHDLFGLMPGMRSDDATRLLGDRNFKCESRYQRNYDRTAKDYCTTGYTDISGIEIIYATALPETPIISISVRLNRNEPIAATLKYVSQQFGKEPDTVSNDLPGGQLQVWNLDGGYTLTLWNTDLKLERKDIANRNKEAWTPKANPAPKL